MKTLSNPPSLPPTEDSYAVYDDPQLQQQFLLESSSGLKSGSGLSARLQLENVRCAGCCGTIEKMINTVDGIISAELNYTTHQLQLTWDNSQVHLSDVIRKIHALGYPAHPVKAQMRVTQLELSRKQLIRQIGVAAGFGMQIMVLAVCLYAGEWWGIEPAFEVFFKYLSLILAIPILMYSGRPFVLGAIDDLSHRRIGMDVPIALGLSTAFFASLYSIYSGYGDVYFDSIAMFVVLVLGARLVELNNRIKATSVLGEYDSVLPDSAVRVNEKLNHTRVPTVSLKSADTVYVDTGDVIPADGVIIQGASSIDESLLTGESMPVTRRLGDQVVAGSINAENPLMIKVVSTGSDTLLSGIVQLVGKAQFEKPRVNHLVERLLSSFVFLVLIIAFFVALAGYLNQSHQWLSATIAVLIVSCPCALALATPAAISMSMGNALRHGLLVSSSKALETLNQTDHFFIDKTGTLTTGEFEIKDIELSGSYSRESALNIAVSLEQYSSHPISNAFKKQLGNGLLHVEDFTAEAGGGLSGTIDGRRYFLGNKDYIQKNTGLDNSQVTESKGTVAILADTSAILARFSLQDTIRPGAQTWLQEIQNSGASVTVLSGDNSSTVELVAKELHVQHYESGCTPKDKLARISEARAKGEITAMLGDGINDAPVIGAAHVSVAVGDRINLSTANADIVVMNPQTMGALVHLLSLSKQLTRVIRQNLAWAFGYNAIAIPFAATGLVPPWLAAIGMSLSSLVVVLNASRLGSWQSPVPQATNSASAVQSPDLAVLGR